MNKFSNFTADNACQKMYEICNMYSPTQKRKKVAKSTHVTIRALQLKLAKKEGEEKEFLEWLNESDIDKDIASDIKKKKLNEKEINWLHTLMMEVQNTKSCSIKLRVTFDSAWNVVKSLWNKLEETK